MSMIGCFYAVSDEDLEAIIEQPKRMHQLWGKPELPEAKPTFVSRLLGVKPKAASEPDGWQPSGKPVAFDVDKAWHGIHFMLTGSDWEGDGPLAFILHGGREIEEDLGYGSPHGFTASEVKEINAALQSVNEAALFERANPEDFARMDIYPQIWTKEPKEECVGYLVEYLTGLKKFVNETAHSGRSLIAYLG